MPVVGAGVPLEASWAGANLTSLSLVKSASQRFPARSKASVTGYQLVVLLRMTSGVGSGSLTLSADAENFRIRRFVSGPGGGLDASQRFPPESKARPDT